MEYTLYIQVYMLKVILVLLLHRPRDPVWCLGDVFSPLAVGALLRARERARARQRLLARTIMSCTCCSSCPRTEAADFGDNDTARENGNAAGRSITEED